MTARLHPEAAATRVGYYGRLSVASSEIERTLDRQEEDAREVADEHGFEIVDRYEDRGKSASKRSVIRPEFQRMLDDLRDAKIDGVVCYAFDRLLRQPKELEALIELYEDCEHVGRRLVFATVEGEIRLDTPVGRQNARGADIGAKYEAEKIAQRVTREHRQRAKLGRASGRNGFGYKQGKTEVEPKEAALIRDAAERVLAGTSVSTIVAEWNAAGVKTRTGGVWRLQTLRDTLASPRIAGQRIYQGRVMLDADGEPVRTGPGIVTDEQHRQLYELLKGDVARYGGTRFRPKAVNGGRDAKYLLSGIVRCGKCLHRMIGTWNAGRGYHYYACPSKTLGGCGETAVTGPRVDFVVVRDLLRRNESKPVALPRPFSDEDELIAVSQQIDELAEALRSRTQSTRVLLPLIDELSGRRDALEAERSAWLASQELLTADPGDVLDLFSDIDDPKRSKETLDRQRAAILKVIDSVVIHPTQRDAGPKFDESRVEIVPRS